MALKHRALCLLLALVLPLVALAGEAVPDAREQALITLAQTLTEHIRAGEEAQALHMMDATMQQALTGKIAGMWASLEPLAGDYQGLGAHRISAVSGYDVVEMTLQFSRLNLLQTTSFDGEGKVAGLFIKPGEVPEQQPALPDGVQEVPVTVDAGKGFPLNGLLTLPAGTPVAGVVLVHGSGPSNMDEAVGGNVPFRDLAHGLAEQGIAVLRYDKRTFTYGSRIAKREDYPRLTVEQETVEDAVAAVALLKGREELQGKPVFLLGHSMGAMLAAHIGAQGADPAGYVLLAGTPDKLWQVSLRQNLAVTQELEQAGDKAQAQQVRQFVVAEEQRALALASLSDAQALVEGNAVFGMSAWYLRHMEGIDAAALHLKDKKPVLVLQGESDRQVTMEDYQRWQQALAGHPDATFISYPGLNHLLGAYQGPQVPLSQLVAVEYAQRTPVGPQVVKDIADWVTQRAQ